MIGTVTYLIVCVVTVVTVVDIGGSVIVVSDVDSVKILLAVV